MSVASEITRLSNAKASIKTSIENKGVTVPSSTKLDGYSSLIDDIQTGGNKFQFVNGGGFSFYQDQRSSLQNELTNIADNVDTSTITNMNSMFYYCPNLTSIDLSGFDTSNVTSMVSLCGFNYELTNINLTGVNTSNVTSMQRMFVNCGKLTTLDLSSFTAEKLTDASSMFYQCTRLTRIDIRNLTLSGITNYTYMFGASTDSSTKVPANCLIIVKSTADKQWITSKFSWLTNVKTVSEL